MLILEYNLTKKPTKDDIKVCNKGAKAMQALLVNSTKILMPKFTWLIWLLTRVYFRKITDKSITYSFPLILDNNKLKKKVEIK